MCTYYKLGTLGTVPVYPKTQATKKKIGLVYLQEKINKMQLRNERQEAKIADQEVEIQKLKDQLRRLESHMGLPKEISK